MSRKPPNILRVMSDPQLFGPHFTGTSWDAWRAYLAAKYALPMSAAMRAIFEACTGRTRPPSKPVKRSLALVGRRGGKDRIAAFEAAYAAAFIDYRPYLAPGEDGAIILVASDRSQAGVLFSYIEAAFDSIPMLAKLVTGRTKESLELGDRRVLISVKTCSHRTIRGVTCVAAFGDEVSFWRDESSANPDVEILRAIEPAQATIPTATTSLLTTPYMRSGVAYKWWEAGFGKDSDDTLIWQAPSATMNPLLDPAVIEAAYEDDSVSAAAEYGAQWRSDLAVFIDPDIVSSCTPSGLYERPPVENARYVAFVDPSGGSSDSFTLAIAHYDREAQQTVLDCVREIVPPFKPDDACAELAAVMKSYGLSSCISDRYGGIWPVSQFATVGIRCEQSAKPKSDIYLTLLPMLNSGTVSLLDVKKLRAQLCGLERRTVRGGRDSVSEPPRSHDDVVNAAAGALVAAAAQPFCIVAPIGISQSNYWSDRGETDWSPRY